MSACVHSTVPSLFLCLPPQHFLHEYVLNLLYQFVTRYQAAPQVVDALVITPVRGYGNFLELGDIDAVLFSCQTLRGRQIDVCKDCER